jgi:hypothetical protein
MHVERAERTGPRTGLISEQTYTAGQRSKRFTVYLYYSGEVPPTKRGIPHIQSIQKRYEGLNHAR